MELPFTVSVSDYSRIHKLRDQVDVGHYFVFVADTGWIFESGVIRRMLSATGAATPVRDGKRHRRHDTTNTSEPHRPSACYWNSPQLSIIDP